MNGRPIAEIAKIAQKLRDTIHCVALFGLISQKSHNNYEIEVTAGGNTFNGMRFTPENAEAAPEGGLVTPSTAWWRRWGISATGSESVKK